MLRISFGAAAKCRSCEVSSAEHLILSKPQRIGATVLRQLPHYTNNSSAAAAAAGSDGSSAAAATSSSSTTAVPYQVEYSVFILDIEKPQPDGTFQIVRTLDQKGLYTTIYGIGYGKGKHPIRNVIDAGVRWVHDSYLRNGPVGKW